MAVTYVGVTEGGAGPTGTDDTGSTLVLTTPAGVVADDALIAAVYIDPTGASAPTWPSGWTLLQSVHHNMGGAGNDYDLAVLSRRAVSSEPSTHTVTWASGSPWRAYTLVALRGGPTSGAVAATYATGDSSGSTTTPSAGPVTVAQDGALVFASGTYSWPTPTAPSGMTQRASRGNIHVATQDAVAAGSVSKTGSYSGTTHWTAFLVVVNPDSGGATPQTVYPQDPLTAQGGWRTQTGGATGLAQTIDEVTIDDADWVQSIVGPTAGDTVEFAAGGITDPSSSTGHIVSVRALVDTVTAPLTLTTELRQGASALSTPASWADTPTGVAQTFTHTLTGPQADAITDYSQLRLRFTATQTAVTSAAPTFVAAGTFVNTATNAATLTPGLPAGWAAGDIHVLIAGRKDNTAMTALSGWTQVPSLSVNNGSTARNEVWYRRAVAGDTAPVVTFGSGTVLRCAQIHGVRGCIATGSPFAQTGVPADNVTQSPFSTTTIQTGALTIAEANVFGIFAFTVSIGPTSASQPTSWSVFTVTRSGNNGIAQGYSTRTYGAAGSSGTPISTLNTGGLGTAVLILLRPPTPLAAASRGIVTWASLTAPAPPVYKNLTGGASGGGSVGATLTKRIFKQLTGAATGTAVPVALVTRRRPLSGGASGQATVAVTLSLIPRPVRELTGAAAGRGQVGTAFLWGGGGLYGAAYGSVWGATGVTIITGGPLPPGPKNLYGTADGVAVATGVIVKGASRFLIGAAVGTSAVTAAPTRRRGLIAASVGSSTVTAAPSRTRPLVAASVGVATVTAAPGRRRVLVASASGLSSASGAISARRSLTAASTGVANTLASIDIAGSVFRALFGSSAGKATNAGQPTRKRALTAASVGVSVTAGSPTRRRPLTALSVGVATVTAVPSKKRSLTASAAGVATISALIGRRRALVGISVGFATTSALLGRGRSLVALSVGLSYTVGVIDKRTIPLTSVIWVVDHFEQGTTGTLVLWNTNVFQTSGDHAQVIWEEDVFKVYP